MQKSTIADYHLMIYSAIVDLKVDSGITPTECRGAVPTTANRPARDRTYIVQQVPFHNSRRGVRHQPSPPPHRLHAERRSCRPDQ